MSIEEYLSQSLMQSSVESYLYDINTYKKNNKNADKYDYPTGARLSTTLALAYSECLLKLKDKS